MRGARWSREGRYVGILLDQAREVSLQRERAQYSNRRFRDLERIHKDVREQLRLEREHARGHSIDVEAGTED